MIRCIAVAAISCVLAVSPANAQKQINGKRGPTTIGATIGAWATGTAFWPRGAVSIDHYFGAFVARAEVWGISRPIVGCAFPTSECSERKLIRGISVGGRLIRRKSDWHPYLGAGVGRNKYFESGASAYAELGIRHDMSDRWGLELRTTLEILAEGSEASGGDTFNVGFWHAIGH